MPNIEKTKDGYFTLFWLEHVKSWVLTVNIRNIVFSKAITEDEQKKLRDELIFESEDRS